MIIEFLGVPGIGKSYVVKRLSYELECNGFKSKLTNEKYYRIKNKLVWRVKKIYSVVILLSQCSKAWEVFFLLMKDNSSLKKRISNIYNVLSVISANRFKINDNLIVLRDEGIYQILFSLVLFSKINVKRIIYLIKQIIETPDMVVYLQSNKSVMEGLKTQDKGGRIYHYLLNGRLNENRIKSSIENILKLKELDSTQVKKYEYNKSDRDLNKIIEDLMLDIGEQFNV